MKTDCFTQGRSPKVESIVGSPILMQAKNGCSYVADFIFTMVAIERQAISKKSLYVAISNGTYVWLAEKLEIRHEYYSNANNTGNVMESLSWFAYEQKRFDFILSIVHIAANLEFPATATPGPATASAPGGTLLRRAAVASGPSA